MKLKKLKICNYRSFGEEQTIDIDNITTIIGHNSAGKTSALTALNTIFSDNVSERILQRSDFHLNKDQKPEDVQSVDLYIEAVFEFDEVANGNGEEPYAIPIFSPYMVVDSIGEKPYLRIRLEATWERNRNLDGEIESSIYYITCPEGDVVTDATRRPANRTELNFIRMLYVPAARDPSKQIKNVSGTMMHQVISAVNWRDKTKADIEATIKQLNKYFVSEKGVEILNDSIRDEWKRYDSDERYSSAELRFNSTDIETSLKKSEVYFSPTVTEKDYTIDEMGDGLRSLFYFSMVDSILDVEDAIKKEMSLDEDKRNFSRVPAVMTIIAIEEPENHISPQLLGELIGNLKTISEKKNAQILMTSHSPAIVKRINPEDIRYLRIDDTKMNTIVRNIELSKCVPVKNHYKYIKEAIQAYPELYFSKLVVLGEGDSEEIVLPKYFDSYKLPLDANGISVVPLGGRHVNYFWKLLSDLNIPHITLLDLDRERYGGGWGRIKYALKQLLEIKAPKNTLLLKSDGTVLKDDELEDMHNWAVNDLTSMAYWIKRLEEWNVFFSSPLDIDFLMLETIEDRYMGLLGDDEGPQLKTKDPSGKNINIDIKSANLSQYKTEFQQRIADDVRNTLKKQGGNGDTYTDKQKELMIWYNYFFLNRGKPITHIEALSGMDEAEILLHTPSVISSIINRIKDMLK